LGTFSDLSDEISTNQSGGGGGGEGSERGRGAGSSNLKT